MAVSKFNIDLSSAGEAKVIVEGVDISSHLQRVTVDAGVAGDRLPRVYLEGTGLGEIEGVGHVIEKMDDRQSVLAWLAEVDPHKLEEEALEAVGLDGSAATVGEAIVLKLMEWASGD